MDEPTIMHAGAAEEAPIPAKTDPVPAGPDQPWKPPVAGEVIVDSKGRKLKLRDLTFLNEADLLDLAGARRADNQNWMWMAAMVVRVQSIDDEEIAFPRNDVTLRKAMQLVGNEGFAAMVDRYAPPPEPELDGNKPTDPGAAAKN